MSASQPVDREAVPSSREFTFVGIAYGLHVTGLFLFWPALVGLLLDYVKRRDVEDTVLASHYGWLIRTFWWSALWGTLIIGAMVWVVLPQSIRIGELARTGDYLSIPWELIAAGVLGGGAVPRPREAACAAAGRNKPGAPTSPHCVRERPAGAAWRMNSRAAWASLRPRQSGPSPSRSRRRTPDGPDRFPRE